MKNIYYKCVYVCDVAVIVVHLLVCLFSYYQFIHNIYFHFYLYFVRWIFEWKTFKWYIKRIIKNSATPRNPLLSPRFTCESHDIHFIFSCVNWFKFFRNLLISVIQSSVKLLMLVRLVWLHYLSCCCVSERPLVLSRKIWVSASTTLGHFHKNLRVIDSNCGQDGTLRR